MTSPELHTLDLFSCLYYAVCRHQTVLVCKLVTESAFYHCICLRSNFVSLTLFFTILVNIMPPSPSQNLPTSWEHQLGFAHFQTLQLTLISFIFSHPLWHKPSQSSQIKYIPSIKDLHSFGHFVARDLEPQLPWRYTGHWKDLLPLTDHNNAYQASGVDFDMIREKFGDIGLRR